MLMRFKDIEKKKQYDREYHHNWYLMHKEEASKKYKEYRLKNLDEVRKRDRERMRLLRRKAFEMLGGKCVYCGCNIPDALEINHINGNWRQERKRGWRKTVQYIEREILKGTYPEPVELTCRVCNAAHYLKMKGMTGFKVIWYPIKEFQEKNPEVNI